MEEEAESAWDRKAQAEMLNCSVCGQPIPYGEKEIYYSTGMCGSCKHISEKDD